MTNYNPTRQQGFVLVATMWVLLVLTIIAGFVAKYVDDTIEDVIAYRAFNHAELDALSTEQTLLYLLSTRRYSRAGLNLNGFHGYEESVFGLPDEQQPSIRLDGRLYHGIGNQRFSLQDEGGLINLARPSSQQLNRYLLSHGASLSGSSVFQARLADYTDRDDFMRMNGATDDDYRLAGWPLPTHRFLSSPTQLRNILQWQNVLSEEAMKALINVASSRSGGFINFNTTPEVLLALEPYLDERSAAEVVKFRQEEVFTSVYQVNQIIGRELPASTEGITFVASPVVRMTLLQEPHSKARVQGISLTPLSLTAPWEIEYMFNQDYDENINPGAATTVQSPFFQ